MKFTDFRQIIPYLHNKSQKTPPISKNQLRKNSSFSITCGEKSAKFDDFWQIIAYLRNQIAKKSAGRKKKNSFSVTVVKNGQPLLVFREITVCIRD